MPLLSDDDFGVATSTPAQPQPRLLSDDEFGVSGSTPTARQLSDDEFGVAPIPEPRVALNPLEQAEVAGAPGPNASFEQWAAGRNLGDSEEPQTPELVRKLWAAANYNPIEEQKPRVEAVIKKGAEQLQQFRRSLGENPATGAGAAPVELPPDWDTAEEARRAGVTPSKKYAWGQRDVDDLLAPPKTPVMENVAQGVFDIATSFDTPIGLATLGIGGLPKAAQKTVSLAFAATMASQTPEIARKIGEEAGKPPSERDNGKIARLLTEFTTTSAFAGVAAAHGLAPEVPEVAPKTGAIAPAAAPQANVPEAVPQADTSPGALADLQAALRGNQGNLKPEQRPKSEQPPEFGEQVGARGEQPAAPIRMPGREMLDELRREQAQASVASEGPKPSVPAPPAPVGEENVAHPVDWDQLLKPNARRDLRDEGVTPENVEALLSGRKTPQQVVDEQLGLEKRSGSVDASTMIVEENADGSRSIGFGPEAGPASTTPVNIGQMSHLDAIQMAREQGVERINSILQKSPKGETTVPGTAAETITGQNERKGSEATAATISAAEPMPAEGASRTGEQNPQTPSPLSQGKKTFFLRPRSDGVPDILDGIQELGGIRPPGPDAGGEYDGYREAMTGPARVLISKTAAHGPDTIIDELKAIDTPGANRIETPDDLWDAISGAVKSRQALRGTDVAQRVEGKQVSEFQRRAIRGDRPKKEAGNYAPVPAGKLLEGDSFEVQGHKFMVNHLEFDQDGNLARVEVKDGPKFGVQTVDGSEFIHVDKNSFEAGPDHDGRTPPELGPVEKEPAAKSDPVMDWLNNAIEKTDPLRPLREGEVGMAFPKWATQTLMNSALKVVRAAYSGGKRLAAAVQEGVEWLRKQNLPGFDQDEAHVALLKAMHSGEGDRPLTDIEARRDAIQNRLAEIDGASPRQPGVKLPADLRSERYQLVKELRDLERQRAVNPDYVRDVFRRMEKLTNDLKIANQAGNGLHARELVDELQSIMDGELPRIPDDLKKRIYDELVAKGEINRSAMKELPAGRSLDDLTAWLKSNGADSPGIPLRERLNLFKKLSDQYNAGKDALAKAWGNLRASWEAFKAQYKSPPKDDDFRSLMKDWFFEKQWTGLETHKWVQEIRAAVPQKVRREAIGVYLDAHGDEQLIRSQADMVPERDRATWETALQLTDKEKALARRIQIDFEQKLSDGQGLGLIDRGRAEYGLPQLWKVKPKYEGEYDPADPQWKVQRAPRNPGSRLDPRDPFFALQRNVPSYFDGIMAGGRPQTLDVGDLVGHYNAEFHDALADRGVIKNLKDAKATDGKPVVMISGAARIEPREAGARSYFVDSNWRPKDAVTEDGRPYRTIDHWALRGWKFSSVDAEGNPILVHGDFLVHPDYYKFLKNELGSSKLRGEQGGPKTVGDSLLGATVFLKSSKFAAAPFHMTTLALHSMGHALSGVPTADRLGLLVPSTRGVELDPGRDPALYKLMRNGLQLGFDGQRELFEDGLASHGGIWGKVPYLGDALRWQSDFLFKRYMPALKVKTAKVVLDANMRRYAAKLSPDQIHELTAEQMNAAFGGQNWRLLGTNKTLLDVSRLMFTSPDFTLSRWKIPLQALRPGGREQLYFLLATAAASYAVKRAANLVLSGNPHWEPSLWDSVVYDGRKYKDRLLVSDISSALQDPVSFAEGRVGPLPKSLLDSVIQRDWRTGQRLSVPFDTDNRALRAVEIMGEDSAKWLVPAGAEGFLLGAPVREDTKASQVAQALLGIGSRKYTAETQMYQAAANFNRNSPDAATQNYQKTRDNEAKVEGQYRKLDDLLDANDLDRARKEFEALRAEGHTEQGFERHFALRPFTGNTQREAQFRQSLSDADAKVYQQAIQERQQRALRFGQMLQAATASR